jgi:hypothetical protein
VLPCTSIAYFVARQRGRAEVEEEDLFKGRAMEVEVERFQM